MLRLKTSGFHDEQQMSPEITHGSPKIAPLIRRDIIFFFLFQVLLRMWMGGLSLTSYLRP